MIPMKILGVSLFFATTSASSVLSAAELIKDETDRNKSFITWGAQVEEFEYRYSDDDQELAVWNADLFYGTDELKVRLLSKGEYSLTEDKYEGLENQIVGQIPISSFFDAKAGVRFDSPNGPDRAYAVAGISGLAPQWFEVDANLFLSDEGNWSSTIDAEYEVLFTNYLVLTANLDATAAFNEDSEIGVGEGLVSTETGLRLSYDVVDRLFSPYIGVVYERKYGDSADLAVDEGNSTSNWLGVLGARFVF